MSGHDIIDFIIRSGLVRAQEESLCVWSANAAEQLEAFWYDAETRLIDTVNQQQEELDSLEKKLSLTQESLDEALLELRSRQTREE